MPITQSDLGKAIELVRHRGIQARIDSKHPDIPKEVSINGKDWKPCEICREEASLVYDAIQMITQRK